MNSFDYPASWEALGQQIPLNAILLNDAQKARATQWSTQGMGTAQQWQIYRNGLALLGFQQWLLDRSIAATLDLSQSSLIQSSVTANLLDAVASVTVGKMQIALCLRPFDQTHPLPLLLHHHQPFRPHLYLWVDLWEETGHTAIASGLWHQDVIGLVPSQTHEWAMELPADAPWLDADQVLLALRRFYSCEHAVVEINHLTTGAIPLSLARLEAKLQQWNALSLYSEVLELQDGLQILRSPQLSRCFEQTLHSKFQSSWLSHINVGQWWSDAVDWFQADMGWQRLPTMAMRSPASENAAILGRLLQQGIQIPAHAQASYCDLNFAAQELRLYTVAWPHEHERDTSWSLLIALCNQPEVELAQPIQFEISDANESLAHEQLLPQTTNACRYIQVTGRRDEKFWVTLTHLQHPDRVRTLPPFGFDTIESA